MNRRTPRWMWACAAAAYVFLYAPLAVVVVFSFNDSKLNAQWVGFTTAWYAKLFRNEEMLLAARNSLVIALLTAAASTVLGTMAGFVMHRYRTRVLPVLVLAPIAIPEILMGVALLMFFVMINMTLGLVSITPRRRDGHLNVPGVSRRPAGPYLPSTNKENAACTRTPRAWPRRI